MTARGRGALVVGLFLLVAAILGATATVRAGQHDCGSAISAHTPEGRFTAPGSQARAEDQCDAKITGRRRLVAVVVGIGLVLAVAGAVDRPKRTSRPSLLRAVDAVTVPVPDLEAGLAFYLALGHELRWRNDAIGQAGLALASGDTELVLTTEQRYEPNWLVGSVDAAASAFREAGGRVLVEPFDIPVGRVAVVADPFDNELTLIDLSKGRYATDADGRVTGVTSTE